MTPKYISLTSKFSIFVGVRVDQRVFLLYKADSGIHNCVTHLHTPTLSLSNDGNFVW